jgi:hypothetical protein
MLGAEQIFIFIANTVYAKNKHALPLSLMGNHDFHDCNRTGPRHFFSHRKG